MKLTSVQKAYLRSAAINPIGRTVVAGGTRTLNLLINGGLVKHLGYCIVEITDVAREALRSEGESATPVEKSDSGD